MAFKQFDIEGIGAITVYKRKASRHLRLSVSRKGEVRVSIPFWAPYKAGVDFARSRSSWLIAQKPTVPHVLTKGQQIGKSYRLHFLADPTVDQPKSRVQAGRITISHSPLQSSTDSAVQTLAEKACLRALRKEAETLLPPRLHGLADRYGYEYSSVTIKRLTGRWGSCDQHRHIILNLFLMQLPWELIDYVILHELAHTRVLRHGPPFWEEMERYTPQAKDLRRRMRRYQPDLHGSP
jgi:predicted metal-dependent hydrolase